jgi:hypothetical protein
MTALVPTPLSNIGHVEIRNLRRSIQHTLVPRVGETAFPNTKWGGKTAIKEVIGISALVCGTNKDSHPFIVHITKGQLSWQVAARRVLIKMTLTRSTAARRTSGSSSATLLAAGATERSWNVLTLLRGAGKEVRNTDTRSCSDCLVRCRNI